MTALENAVPGRVIGREMIPFMKIWYSSRIRRATGPSGGRPSTCSMITL